MILPSGYAHVVIAGGGTGMPQRWAITFGLELALDNDDPQELANGLQDDWQSSTIMSNFQSSVVQDQILVKFGPTATGPSATNSEVTAGSAAGSQAPPNVATLVHKVTAFGGRAGRGRMYLPPVSENSVTADGLIDSGLRSAIQIDLDSFFAKVLVRGPRPVLLHGAGSPLSAPTPITGFAVDGRVATQRRRLRR